MSQQHFVFLHMPACFCQGLALKSPELWELGGWGGQVRSRGLFHWPGSGWGAPVPEQVEGQGLATASPLLSPDTGTEAKMFLVALLTIQLVKKRMREAAKSFEKTDL